MGTVINIGIIGASWFSDLWFLPVLTKHPQVHVTAICSKNGDSAHRMAAKYDIPAVYTSAEEMMDAEQLDGVCIITPNNLHHPLAMAAMKRGIHVLCEKPLAIDAEQSKEMLQLAEERNLVHCVNFSVREHSGIQYLRQHVREGAIGEYLEGRFEYSGDYGLGGSPGWRGHVTEAGAGGVLQDLGSHVIDLAQYILNDRIKAVSASVRCLEAGSLVNFDDRANRDQAADSVYIQAEFAGGGHGDLQTSWVRPQGSGGQTVNLELYGTKGALKFQMTGYGYKLNIAKKGEAWQEIELPAELPWDLTAEPSEDRFRPYRDSEKNEAWKWASAVFAAKFEGGVNREGLPGFDDANHVQQVIDAVLQSASEKKQVIVEE
ncbi:Gfo/Idh/MocA family protein [Paenibacillus solisilvae]|uniref:Gfo/Idh/MocA family protein n=1 Tax=Paenibacillus solisilvae TaxID=2486751 RepID=A0ABW0VU58_9BACL